MIAPRNCVVSLLLLSVPLASAQAQRPFRVDTAVLQRLLTAEDARGTGRDGIAPILAGMGSRDTLLRRVAVRALGRLQRPELARDLAGALRDPVAAVRSEAANAVAQSLVRVKRRHDDPAQATVQWAVTALVASLDAEHDPAAAEAIAESLGRLPFGDSTSSIAAESALLHHAAGYAGFGTVHGLYWISLNRATTGGLMPDAVTLLRGVAWGQGAAATRRVAVLTLAPLRQVDSALIAMLMTDPDEQLRRLALEGVGALSAGYRGDVVRVALADPSPIVRVAAVSAARVGNPSPDCTDIIAATTDAHPYVALAAIDALGSPCADSVAAVRALALVLDEGAPNHRSWPARNHAMIAWAKHGGFPLRIFSRSIVPMAQPGIVGAAAVMGDTDILMRAARSVDNNVRETAIDGLAKSLKHNADSVFIAALSSHGYQVVRAAANALAGTREPRALPALLDNFDRLSRERRENSRDPRVAMLQRISELGSGATTARLIPYLSDFDTTIAFSVAATLSKWSGTAIAPHPVPLKRPVKPLAATFLARNVQLRVTMANGGVFTVRLFTDEAPATAARIIALARASYYDGHVFQRVEPNFVVQGGGPDANEYVGDAGFMRDEIAWRSHLRGTLGISSRGRDTGDAQWFFNLVDNTRLDHEYTVFGEVASGLNVVERIMEGDVIGKVVVVGR